MNRREERGTHQGGLLKKRAPYKGAVWDVCKTRVSHFVDNFLSPIPLHRFGDAEERAAVRASAHRARVLAVLERIRAAGDGAADELDELLFGCSAFFRSFPWIERFEVLMESGEAQLAAAEAIAVEGSESPDLDEEPVFIDEDTEDPRPCEECGGRGEKDGERCGWCRGHGRIAPYMVRL